MLEDGPHSENAAVSEFHWAGGAPGGLFEVLTSSWARTGYPSTWQCWAPSALSWPITCTLCRPTPFWRRTMPRSTSLFTHHVWIGGLFDCGGRRPMRPSLWCGITCRPRTSTTCWIGCCAHRDAIISHLAWVCQFLGFHSFAMYCHNDTMRAFGRPQDMFSDTGIQLQPIFRPVGATHSHHGD